MLDTELKGKVVLLTGANNPYGVGAGVARAFSTRGARVFLHYFRQDHATTADAPASPGDSFYYSQQGKSADEVLESVRKLADRPAPSRPIYPIRLLFRRYSIGQKQPRAGLHAQCGEPRIGNFAVIPWGVLEASQVI